MLCPKCNSPMIERRGKWGAFYGCSRYPDCKHIVNKRDLPKEEPKPFVRATRKWSKLQEAIFDFGMNDSRNLIIQAVAGSGKSTTIAELASRLIEKDSSQSLLYCTFAKKNVQDMQGKIDPRVTIKTMHSIGYACLSSWFRSHHTKMSDPDSKKLNRIFSGYVDSYQGDKDLLKASESSVLRIVELIKDTLLDCSLESISFLCDRYGILLNSDTMTILQAVDYVYRESMKFESGIIDYSDMIYLVVNGNVPVTVQYDFILIDECQDLNPAQLKMLELILSPTGRIIAVGDRFQSIYGFRAADTEAMDKIKARFNCVELPLSVSYRCPEWTMNFVNEEFPDIQFTSGSIIEGDCYELKLEKLANIIYDGELILCRNNAPLVKPCYQLIKAGKNAVILGRDFSSELTGLIVRIVKKYECESVGDLFEALEDYEDKELEKLSRLNNSNRIESFKDRIETIRALSEDIDNIADLYAKINSIFSDEKGQVTLSSIHRAKGAEADNVYLLQPELIGKNAKQDWEKQQESNLKYVAYTRHKNNIYEVR